MSSPRVIVQLVIVGSRILGKALLEAGRQAVKNAKHRPQGGIGDAAGVGNARSGSVTDRLTREHLMTLDEARMILNLKQNEPMEKVLQHYEHLFQANAPPVAAEAKAAAEGAAGGAQQGRFFNSRGAGPRYHSIYLQSKIVRARERIEAETKLAEEAHETVPEQPEQPPPPPSSS
ncbi:hypothetical protein EXIGLDRAFT_711427 [Exidia glandulosa HHB12029]|uniref:Mitochondrial import inner membrane translocase subunit TIM16 n=1 Tax=Exidia glandulosa HHB12029 TaxID=1314781 RepID=A0A165N5W1_EXIGL|nr:hypothetical protein EXIGLDRAFT_711427 [Exidia glandulosa HHB12029]